MPFWSDAKVADPKRSHRWLIEIGSAFIGSNISYIAKGVNRPKMEIGVTDHKFLNHTFYYPGGVTFGTVTVKLVDPANPHATEQLYDLIQASGYKLPGFITDAVGVGPEALTIGKRMATTAVSNVKIHMLNSLGEKIETMELHNPWIKSLDFGGELAYDQEGLMEISMEFQFDWVSLKTYTPGNGPEEQTTATGFNSQTGESPPAE